MTTALTDDFLYLVECPVCTFTEYVPGNKCPKCGYEYLLSTKKIGDEIDNRYAIHQIIEGGVGRVFLCYDKEWKTPVAIKTILPSYFTDKTRRELFLKEAENWIRLEQHVNIVKAHYVEDLSFFPAIFMELVAGEYGYVDLRKRMQNGCTYTLSDVIDFGIQFCNGMLHCAKIFKQNGKVFVHKDIKPSNILITDANVLKITDFGLSLGTKEYKAPEWGSGQGIDQRSDIYSFGKTFIEFLSSLSVVDTNKLNVLEAKCYNIFSKCCADDEKNRFKSFEEIKVCLLEFYTLLTGNNHQDLTSEKQSALEKVNYATSLGSLGFHKEAALILEKIPKIVLNPSNPYQISDIPGRDFKLWYNLGFASYRLKQYKNAQKYLQLAISIEPHPRIISLLGIVYFEQGDFTTAAECLNKAIILNPKDHITLRYIIELLIRDGKIEEAIGRGIEALEITPNSAVILKVLGNAYMKSHQYDTAIEYFKKVEAINPADNDVYNSIGASYEMKSDFNAAIYYYKKHTSLQSNDWRVHMNLASLNYRLENYEESSQDLEKVALLLPDSLGDGESDIVKLQYLGICHYGMNNNVKAIDCFNKALALDPNNLTTKGFIDSIGAESDLCFELTGYINNCNEMLFDGRYDEAIVGYGEVLCALDKMKKRFLLSYSVKLLLSQCYCNKGISFLQAGKYDMAEESLNSALSVFPNSPEVLASLGYCYFYQGNIKNAIDILKKALKYQNNPSKKMDILDLLITCSENLGEQGQVDYFKSMKIDIKGEKSTP